MSKLRLVKAYLRYFLGKSRMFNVLLSVAVIGTVWVTAGPRLPGASQSTPAGSGSVVSASSSANSATTNPGAGSTGTAGAVASAGGNTTTANATTAGGQPAQAVPKNIVTSGFFKNSGAKLVDAKNQEVRLTGVNWFGMETSSFAPHGLWARNWQEMMDQMAKAGFNTLRLPYSNQLFDASSVPNGIDYSKNADLVGLNGLQIMDKIIEGAGKRGMKVILDRHRPMADAQSELWYTDKVSEQRWTGDWVMLANRYKGNTTVIGADLHNEPRGQATWGDGNVKTDWRLAAERAGNAILEANPDWLIIVEGIEKYKNDYYWWGGNLGYAREFPIRLSNPAKLMYSAHEYGPGVYNQSWFSAKDFPNNLANLWNTHWAYVQQEGMAPLLMGEFGGRSVGQDTEGTWQRTLMSFLKDNNISYTYWSWNPNSGDTGGILKDDWSSIDDAKLKVLADYQWPMLDKPAQ